MYNKIDNIFKLWQRENAPGGQVLVRHKGEIIFDKCYGKAVLEHDIDITDKTVFHVASVSKQVTIMSLLILWNEGKVDLDADIRTYLPEYIAFDTPVTVRQCMNNVSGIRDQWELLIMRGTRIDDIITQKDLLKVISTQKELNFIPQSQYLYSNSNFTLCAEIVRKISGKPLNEFAKERIFDVLGMDSTCIKMGYKDIVKNRAQSYLDNGCGSYVNQPLNFGVAGATSLNTNVHDFIKLMDEYKNPKHFDKAIFDVMFTPAVLTSGETSIYGGGMMIQEHKGHKIYTHGGVDAGYRADMAIYPDDDLDIVIFANTQNTIPGVASKKIADIVLGLPCDDEFVCSQPVDKIDGAYIGINEPHPFYMVNNGCLNGNPLIHIKDALYALGETVDRIDLGEKPKFKIGAGMGDLRRISLAPVNKDILGKYYSEELDIFYYITENEGKMFLSHYKEGDMPLYDFAENTYATPMCRIKITENGFALSGGRAYNIKFVKL
ncbi:MAG: beta-lactamase family protein [Clostridia bacterium]|nr:beta-lactamase family protein [Clostridia bacterium]